MAILLVAAEASGWAGEVRRAVASSRCPDGELVPTLLSVRMHRAGRALITTRRSDSSVATFRVESGAAFFAFWHSARGRDVKGTCGPSHCETPDAATFTEISAPTRKLRRSGLSTSEASKKLLKNGTLKTYNGFPHGMPTTHAETINADLLAFLRS
jgi:hypothetical protein